nr:rRNA pseudouridine synthase [Oceanococcus sp. HetDA_MAG_MS8]
MSRRSGPQGGAGRRPSRPRQAERAAAKRRAEAAANKPQDPPERVQRLLSRLGLGSRREIEGWISEGRLHINGEPAAVGAQATANDRFELDGKPLRLRHQAPPRVLVYRKRVGEVVSRNDPQQRHTIFERLPRLQGGRWIAVGRLDINTSGVLLVTNDGELAARLMHPSYEIEREYAVRVLGGLSESALQQLREGVMLDDGLARVTSIRPETDPDRSVANHWYRLSLAEGRNREVRRMIEAVGGQVSRLLRVRYGPVEVPRGVASGRSRDLTAEEFAAVYEAVGLAVPQREEKRGRQARSRGPG